MRVLKGIGEVLVESLVIIIAVIVLSALSYWLNCVTLLDKLRRRDK